MNFKSTEKFHWIGKRRRQEDSFYISADKLIICDGIGGFKDGHLASEIAVNEFARINFDDAESALNLRDSISNSLEEISKKYDKIIDVQENMGTTLVMLIQYKFNLYSVHIGDSKLLHYSPSGNMKFATIDHSLIQDLYQNGAIKNKDDLKTHPLRNIITKSINRSRNEDVPEINEISNCMSGDIIILCSDGVLESVNETEIGEIIKNNPLSHIKKSIFSRVKEKSNDNSTFIITLID